MDLHGAMRALAEERPLFHSEADFQHALAWQLHRQHPEARVRLESRPRPRTRLDVLFEDDTGRTAIELKYLAASFEGTVDDEAFTIPAQDAQDVGRYGVIRDIERVESFVAGGYVDRGWVVALSMDAAFWTPHRGAETVDTQFRLHEGRELYGELGWGAAAGEGTKQGHEQSIRLRGRYLCRWAPFTTVSRGDGRELELRYLYVEVGPMLDA